MTGPPTHCICLYVMSEIWLNRKKKFRRLRYWFAQIWLWLSQARELCDQYYDVAGELLMMSASTMPGYGRESRDAY